MAVGGPPAQHLVLLRRLSEPEDDPGIEIATWMILALVVGILTCMICCCTCFVIYKFAPENTQGPAWEISSKGTRFIGPNRGDDDRPAVTPENDDYRSYVNGVPRLDVKTLYPQKRSTDPGYARPINWEKLNRQEHGEYADAIHAQRRGSEGTGKRDAQLAVNDPRVVQVKPAHVRPS